MGEQSHVYHDQILAGTLTVVIPVGTLAGHIYKNIWAILDVSAMSAGETLDFYGQDIGGSDYRTAILIAQTDVKAIESTIVAKDLSGLGPLTAIKCIATNIAAAETIDIYLHAYDD